MVRKVIRTSADETITRFGTLTAAEKYSTALEGTKTHLREVRCIQRALQMVPVGGRVLDLPCGAGRLLPPLTGLGFQVVAVDSSPHMVALARKRAEARGFQKETEFLVSSIFDTGFNDDTFDAVICNRLFHHFREPQIRRDALRELRRLCDGTIVVSFFCNLALDALVFHLKNVIRRKKPSDRIPISYGVFARDIDASGLRIERSLATRPGISRQWYFVVRRKFVH
ncbi:MAG: methyltransferase domain-containing protein [Deltaproteobacteria bacterium]|nr:methyltransferase domain-containing protein [Deltaproteobacteria bacterium]